MLDPPYLGAPAVLGQEFRGCSVKPKYNAMTVVSPSRKTLMAIVRDMLIIHPRYSAHHEERDYIEHDRGLQHFYSKLVMEERARIGGVDEAESRQHDERQQSHDNRARPRLRGERAQLMLCALTAAHPF